MPLSTAATGLSRLKSIRTYFVPARVVNLCFVIVLVSSTLLTWREVVVLEDAWVASQRNTLDKVSSALDRQMEIGVRFCTKSRCG